MARTKGMNGPALGAVAVGGLLIYAAVTDQPITDALRNLITGKAAKPGPFVKPAGSTSSADGDGSGTGAAVTIGAGPLASLAIAASKYLGRPYRWGGNFDPPDGGGDCSGLVWRSFKDLGINAPRISSAQLLWKQTRKLSRADVSAGDLVGHPGAGAHGHIGIAISNTEGIFAPHPGTVVQVQNIDNVIVRSIGIYVRYVGPQTSFVAGGVRRE